MEFGAQLYTVRDFTQNEEDFKSTLKRIAEIGYKNIQISAVGPIAPEIIKSIADYYGLKIVVTHYDVNKIQNDTKAVIEHHKKLGCENIGIGYFPFNGESSYYQFIKDFEKPMKMMKENGMKLHYHNHSFEFERFGQRTGYDILIEETDKDLFGFILDTYWVQVGGKNPSDLIERLKGRISCMHIKDMSIQNGNQCIAEIMEGNLDFDKILTSCKNSGVQYALVEQDGNWRVDPFTSLETSYKNIKKKKWEEKNG